MPQTQTKVEKDTEKAKEKIPQGFEEYPPTPVTSTSGVDKGDKGEWRIEPIRQGIPEDSGALKELVERVENFQQTPEGGMSSQTHDRVMYNVSKDAAVTLELTREEAVIRAMKSDSGNPSLVEAASMQDGLLKAAIRSVFNQDRDMTTDYHAGADRGLSYDVTKDIQERVTRDLSNPAPADDYKTLALVMKNLADYHEEHKNKSGVESRTAVTAKIDKMALK